MEFGIIMKIFGILEIVFYFENRIFNTFILMIKYDIFLKILY